MGSPSWRGLWEQENQYGGNPSSPQKKRRRDE
jgi:hypothetical protein